MPRLQTFCPHHRLWHRPGDSCLPAATAGAVPRLDWRKLAGAGESADAELRALDGRRICVVGYMAPFEARKEHRYFMLAAWPPECLCCPPGGPTEVIEVMARAPLPFRRDCIRLGGTFRAVAGDGTGFLYHLDDAAIADGHGETDSPAAEPRRAALPARFWPRPTSRRAVVRGLASLAALGTLPLAATAPAPALAQAAASDIRTGDILKTPAVDLHSHAGGQVVGNRPPYDVAATMVEGQFGVVTLSAVADSPLLRRTGDRIAAFRQPGDGELYRNTDRQLGYIDAMIDDQKFVRVHGPDDIAAAYAAGRPAMLVAIEGCDFLEGRLDRVAWAHGRGVRHLQLVHYRVNDLGDIQTEAPRHNGLTDFGADAVRECNRLGIIVDVAHATRETTARAAAVSKTPIVMSHGGPSGQVRPGSRMMTWDHAQIVVDSGGVIGLWPNGYMFHTFARWIDYIVSVAKRVGVDAVAIGSDMEGGIDEVFDRYTKYPALVQALLAKGLSPAEVAKIAGGNHARVFAAVAAAAG